MDSTAYLAALSVQPKKMSLLKCVICSTQDNTDLWDEENTIYLLYDSYSIYFSKQALEFSEK